MQSLFFCSDSGVDRSSGEAFAYSHRNGVEGIVRLGRKAGCDWKLLLGVQRLQRLGYDIPMDLYMKWLGMAAKIQQRNELMNRRCVEV